MIHDERKRRRLQASIGCDRVAPWQATSRRILKERIVRSVMDEGYTQAETAQRFMTTEATVSRTMRALRERGTIAPVEFTPGPAPKLQDVHVAWLKARVEQEQFLSTYELTPMFNEAFPEVAVHRSTILRALHRLGLSPKKRPASRRSGSRTR